MDKTVNGRPRRMTTDHLTPLEHQLREAMIVVASTYLKICRDDDWFSEPIDVPMLLAYHFAAHDEMTHTYFVIGFEGLELRVAAKGSTYSSSSWDWLLDGNGTVTLPPPKDRADLIDLLHLVGSLVDLPKPE